MSASVFAAPHELFPFRILDINDKCARLLEGEDGKPFFIDDFSAALYDTFHQELRSWRVSRESAIQAHQRELLDPQKNAKEKKKTQEKIDQEKERIAQVSAALKLLEKAKAVLEKVRKTEQDRQKEE